MTWSKRGQEFSDECAHAELTDAAYRTHSEAIDWLFRVEEMTTFIPKRMLLRFAGSDDVEAAVGQLVAVGFWRDLGKSWEVVHHADVIRQGIVAQQDKRSRDKRAQAAARKRNAGPKVGANKRANVSADVSADTVSQSVAVRPKVNSEPELDDSIAAERGAREHEVRAKKGLSAPDDEVGGKRSPIAPSPESSDGPITGVHDDQHFRGNGSAGAKVADRYARAERPRQPCPVCGTKCRLKPNGRIWIHGDPVNPCPGSEQLPAMAAS